MVKTDSNIKCLTLANYRLVENQGRERRGGGVGLFDYIVIYLSPALKLIDSLKSLKSYLDGIDRGPDD